MKFHGLQCHKSRTGMITLELNVRTKLRYIWGCSPYTKLHHVIIPGITKSIYVTSRTQQLGVRIKDVHSIGHLAESFRNVCPKFIMTLLTSFLDKGGMTYKKSGLTTGNV